MPLEEITYTGEKASIGTIALAGLTVVLVSLTRGIGFYFPMADISKGESMERLAVLQLCFSHLQ